MSKREASFRPRTIRLVGPAQVGTALSAIQNCPYIEQDLEVVIRPVGKVRSLDHNARMWAGPLKDMEEQAWMNGRQYSAEVWHEYAKRQFLPEVDDPDLDRLVKNPETWRKWDIDPAGERVCVGSTTQLTPYGMSQHLMQLEALGAELGVMFSEAPMRHAA